MGEGDSQENKFTIIFFGDSITYAGGLPGGYVNLVAEAFKDQNNKIEVIAAGVPGHKVTDLAYRLEGEVLSHSPDIVVIFIGINDVWHSARGLGTKPEVFEQVLRDLATRISDAGARPYLCTLSVINEKREGANEFDDMLDQYSEMIRLVARTTSTPVIDLREAFVEHLRVHNPGNLEQGILTSDGVHLNDAGNRFLADIILSVLNMEPGILPKQMKTEHN